MVKNVTLNNFQRKDPALWCWKMLNLLGRGFGLYIQVFMKMMPEMEQKKCPQVSLSQVMLALLVTIPANLLLL